MKRIGILGGLSAESTALFYQSLVRMHVEQQGDVQYPEIVIFSVRFGDFVRWAKAGDWVSYVNGLVDGLQALEKAGADFAVIAANTPHVVYEKLVERVSLPILHIAESLAEEASRKSFRKVALLGTPATMKAEFYPRTLGRYGIECEVPIEARQARIDTILEQELFKGIVREKSRAEMIEIVNELRESGSEAVILGCTELPMLLDDTNSPLPTLDSSLLLARATLNRAREE